MDMVLSGYQARYFTRLSGYLPGRPMELVPVTQYLYHHYIPCIFRLTSAPFSTSGANHEGSDH